MANVFKKKYSVLILCSFVFIASLSFTYAFFSLSNVENNSNDEIVTTGVLSINYSSGPQIIMNNIMPGATSSKTFIVTNTGTLNTSYDIRWNDYQNEIINDELIIHYTCTSYINYGYLSQEVSGSCNSLESTPIGSNGLFLNKGISIDVGITHVYDLTIEFIETSEEQNYNQHKLFSGTLNILDTETGCLSLAGTNGITVPSDPVDETSFYDVFICLNNPSILNLSETKYVVSRSSEQLGENNDIWDEAHTMNTTNQYFYGIFNEPGLYYVHTLLEYTDGRKHEMISDVIDVTINQNKRITDLSNTLANMNSEPISSFSNIKYDFVQLWQYNNNSYRDIYKNMKVLKRAGYEGVILNYVSSITNVEGDIQIDSIFYDSSITNTINSDSQNVQENVVDYFFTAANILDLDVVIGTPLSNDWYSFDSFLSSAWIDEVNNYTIDVIDELYTKYGSNESFAGWYYSNEMYTNNKNYEQYWITKIDEIVDYLNTLENRGIFMVSPFLSSYYVTSPESVEQSWTTFMNSVSFQDGDIFSVQDGYGTSKYSTDSIYDYHVALRNAVKSNTDVDIKFYSNVENYDEKLSTVTSIQRTNLQVQLAKYTADGLLSFSYTHYYSPFSTYNNLDNKYVYDLAFRGLFNQNLDDTGPITYIDTPQSGAVYVDSNFKEAPIPNGFTVSSNENERNIDSGLVIIDGYGNEFVWIPVDYGVADVNFDYEENYNKVAYLRYLENALNSIGNLNNDLLPSGVENDTHQIEKYEGFYVGRYESSYRYINDTSTCAVKKISSDSYVDLSFTPFYASSEVYNDFMLINIEYSLSKTLAENMSSAYDYHSSIKTGMINGKMWDTLLRWISLETFGGHLYYLGENWGNYSDSISPAINGNYVSGELKGSGSNENWKARNIYDIAGNLREWTSEISTNNDYVIRDVGFNGSGNLFGPQDYTITPSYRFNDVGVRVVLYIN